VVILPAGLNAVVLRRLIGLLPSDRSLDAVDRRLAAALIRWPHHPCCDAAPDTPAAQ
jgi:hypothetical protein